MPEQKEINQTKPKILDFEQQEVKGKVGGMIYTCYTCQSRIQNSVKPTLRNSSSPWVKHENFGQVTSKRGKLKHNPCNLKKNNKKSEHSNFNKIRFPKRNKQQ